MRMTRFTAKTTTLATANYVRMRPFSSDAGTRRLATGTVESALAKGNDSWAPVLPLERRAIIALVTNQSREKRSEKQGIKYVETNRGVNLFGI
ncbi:hypothetical protein LSAT2_006726 [Lamellibrachia satsuma]|nr:hypothetical protein LSAT2_006726 [Lamellibrachia satsuma]